MVLVLVVICLLIPTFVTASCYSIDRDHDGYGVGDVDLKGADADDSDPAINTPASIHNKYPSFNAFLRHKGYFPARIFYISAQGDDQTGQVDDPDSPYLTGRSENLGGLSQAISSSAWNIEQLGM